MKNFCERILLEIKVKNALELPISNRDIIAAKLASKKENTPYCSGPKLLATIIPVAKDIIALVVFATTEKTKRFAMDISKYASIVKQFYN